MSTDILNRHYLWPKVGLGLRRLYFCQRSSPYDFPGSLYGYVKQVLFFQKRICLYIKYVIPNVYHSQLSHREIWILNTLCCFQAYKICIYISYHILDFVPRKKTKFAREQPYTLPSLYCQYHACWCLDVLRSQNIIRHSIDPLKPEYSVYSISRVNLLAIRFKDERINPRVSLSSKLLKMRNKDRLFVNTYVWWLSMIETVAKFNVFDNII